MKVRCGARLRTAPLRCRRFPVPGRTRCYRHGGRFNGPVTPEGRARSEAARLAGHKRYIARMWAAKRMGLIDKIPGGPKSKGKGKQLRYRLKEAAMEILEKKIETLPAVPDKPFDEQSPSEQFTTLTRMSLKKARDILAIACDDDNYKLMSIQKELAQSTIAMQVRIDETMLRRQSADRLPEMLERLEAVKAAIAPKAPVIIDVEPQPANEEEIDGYPL